MRPGFNVVKLRISVLRIVSVCFRKKEHGTLDGRKIRYGERITKYGIRRKCLRYGDTKFYNCGTRDQSYSSFFSVVRKILS